MNDQSAYIHVASKYREYLADRFGVTASNPDPASGLPHLAWLCDWAIIHAIRGDRETAATWCAFVGGACWALGIGNDKKGERLPEPMRTVTAVHSLGSPAGCWTSCWQKAAWTRPNPCSS